MYKEDRKGRKQSSKSIVAKSYTLINRKKIILSGEYIVQLNLLSIVTITIIGTQSFLVKN